jgi:hypothetical protein
MDKNINDNDRIIIGVREWAIDSVFTKGFGLDRWLLITEEDKKIDAKAVVGVAQELEEYVLRDIGQPTFKPKPYHYFDRDKD